MREPENNNAYFLNKYKSFNVASFSICSKPGFKRQVNLRILALTSIGRCNAKGIHGDQLKSITKLYSGGKMILKKIWRKNTEAGSCIINIYEIIEKSCQASLHFAGSLFAKKRKPVMFRKPIRSCGAANQGGQTL